MAIVTVRIHPAIGVARLGNSPDEWFLGPELPGVHPAPAGGFKDAACRVKRQGARFRIFGYDAAGNVEQELTAADAAIEWRVHLANRKAAAEKYDASGLRNAGITGADRAGLVIDPGEQKLNGSNQRVVLDKGTLTLPGQPAAPVPLGEIRTDDDGHLVVLGGFGTSASPDSTPLSGDIFNSDRWYDDTADGPVSATVTLPGGAPLQAEGAWVIIGPPKFAPPLDNIITLHDRLFHVFAVQSWLSAPATPSYTTDIYPLLHRASRIFAVRSAAQGHHTWTHPVVSPGARAFIFGRLTTPTAASVDMPDLNESSLKDGRLTPTQWALMEKWKDGTFINDWAGVPTPPTTITPSGLDRAAMDDCCGAAFYPGIEAGAFLLDAAKYTGPFRLNHAVVDPGDVTARMALPWQTDFYACATDWWPVPRPNNVVPQGTTAYQDWTRGIGTGAAMVTNWHTLGYVVEQPEGLVETERCDTATITLLTPSLDFIDVPQGYGGAPRRQSLAIAFEIIAPGAAVTLEYLNGPTHPRLQRFSPGPVSVGPTGPSAAAARFFITYQTGPVGEVVADAVTIREAVSGQQWTIDISANTVARKKAAVALVLDRSGSMNEDRGDGISKYQSLQDAAELFVDVMQQEDATSLVRYNQDAQVVSGLTAVGPQDPLDPARNALKALITGASFAPGGATSIGDGIEAGRGTLAGAAGYAVKALVVLTDGKENQDKRIADVAASIDERTFAIGLGTPQNTSIATLQTLAGNHGGYALVTGNIGGDNLFLLQKYFLQILGGITNAELVLDPQGQLRPGSVHRIPFLLTEADLGVDVVVLSPLPHLLRVAVESPNGLRVDPTTAAGRPDAVFSRGRGHSMYRLQLPIEYQSARFDQAGTWHVLLQIGRERPDPDEPDARRALTDTSIAERRRLAQAAEMEALGAAEMPRSVRERRTLPYSVVIHSHSDVSMRASLRQRSFEPGTIATVEAILTQFSAPLDQAATVRVSVTQPDGATYDVTLNALGGGRYGVDQPLTQAGIYRFLVRAVGTSAQGWPFTREQALTAPVWQGGDLDPAGDPATRDLVRWLTGREEALCDVINCLGETALASPQIRRWAQEWGVEPERVLRCLQRFCDRARDRGGEADG